MFNSNGHYDNKLKCYVYTWRDAQRCLVGFIYKSDDNSARVVYFSPTHYTYGVKIHVTDIVHVESHGNEFGGYRLLTTPDPETDTVVRSVDLPEEWQ